MDAREEGKSKRGWVLWQELPHVHCSLYHRHHQLAVAEGEPLILIQLLTHGVVEIQREFVTVNQFWMPHLQRSGVVGGFREILEKCSK